MTDDENIAQAKVTPLKSISKIWFIPILAILIGSWMTYFHFSRQGPSIIIHFSTGEGIEAGKTKIKIKNVEVGRVNKVELGGDVDGVTVTARIQKRNQHLLKPDTQFWVVRPRIGKAGISGLGTLLSGAYIELSPGSQRGEQFDFYGLESEPVTPSGTPGLRVTLDTGGYRALDVGDPILFHGIDVGRIEYVHFNTQERTVYYDAFIESPYDKLITTNTKFWEVNGIEVELSADGIRVQSGTLNTLISGGVTFDVPKDMPRGELVTEREYFTVFPNKNAIYESRHKHVLEYILLFNESIRGLKTGAPVEYRGIKIGTVIRIDLDYPEITNLLKKDSFVPVMVTIEPARIGFEDSAEILPQVKKDIMTLLKQGLRGGLANGNLLTGSKYIELEYDEQLTLEPEYFNNYRVIPTLASQFNQIIKRAAQIMDKLYELPIEPVINNAEKSLKQVTETLVEFQHAATQLKMLLKQSTDEQLVSSIKDTLERFQSLSSDFSAGSLTHTELQGMLHKMKQALSQLEPLLIQLNQKPNSLIFSDQKNKDIEPKGIKQ